MNGQSRPVHQRASGRSTRWAARALCISLWITVLHGAAAKTVGSAAELTEALASGAQEIVVNSTEPIILTGSSGKSVLPEITGSVKLLCAFAAPFGQLCQLHVQSGGGVPLFYVGSGGDLAVEGLVIRGGVAERGAAVYVAAGGAVHFQNTLFQNNTAKSFGGAVYVEGGRSSFMNVTFRGNGDASGNLYGGAIYADGLEDTGVNAMEAHVKCIGCLFHHNSAKNGGAIGLTGLARMDVIIADMDFNVAAVAGGSIWAGPRPGEASVWADAAQGNYLTLEDVRFVANKAGVQGGAAHFQGLNDWMFVNCEFTSNVAISSPGASLTDPATATKGGAVSGTGSDYARLYSSFQGCKFLNNRASRGGAVALSVILEGSLQWFKCSFVNNTAPLAGGALWMENIRKVADINGCKMESCSSLGGLGGAVFTNNSNIRVRESTLFHNNSAKEGGAIWAGGFSDVTLGNSTLVSNLAVVSGGALSVRGVSRATVSQTLFALNAPVQGTNELHGGAVSIQGEEYYNGIGAPPSTFTDCVFTDNLADMGGAMLVTAAVTLFECQFRGNTAVVGGAILANNATQLTATDCEFLLNIADDKGGAAMVQLSKAEFKDCDFIANRAHDQILGTDEEGGAIFVSGSAAALAVKFSECLFKENTADFGGAAYFTHGASVRLDDCWFIGNSASEMGGAVRIGTPGDDNGGALVEFAGVLFSNHTASKGAGAIDVRNSRAKMSSCTFAGNSAFDESEEEDQWGGAVRITDPSSEVDFDTCEFQNNSADYGGAVFAGVGAGVLFTKSTFTSNTAQSGGAVRVESAAEVMANECIFQHQEATEGGALSALGPLMTSLGQTTVWIRNSKFTENSADASGGAVCAIGASVFFKSNTFHNNTVYGIAGQGGGAFALNSGNFGGQVVPGQMTFEDDSFSGHAAHTGGTGAVGGLAEVSIFQSKLIDSFALAQGGALYASGPGVQINLRHVDVKNSVAGGVGGCVAVDDGGTLFAQSTTFQSCQAGNLSAMVANGNEPGITAKSGLAFSMGGALALSGNSTAILEKPCHLLQNTALGYGGAISAVDSMILARQTVFSGNSASNGGGALHSENSLLMLLNAPSFDGNSVSDLKPSRRRRQRRMLATVDLQQMGTSSGGALNLLGSTYAVCEQCEFTANQAPLGADVFIAPEVQTSDVVLSVGSVGGAVQVFPASASLPGAQSCWPLQCSLPWDSASTTTCGGGVVHQEQLTGGTSSVSFAGSVAFTTKMPLIEPSGHTACVRSCLDSEILISSQSCSALDNNPSPPALPPGGLDASSSPSPSPQAPILIGNDDQKENDDQGASEDAAGLWIEALAITLGMALSLLLLCVVFFVVMRQLRKRAAHDSKWRARLPGFMNMVIPSSPSESRDFENSRTKIMDDLHTISEKSVEPNSRDAILVHMHIDSDANKTSPAKANRNGSGSTGSSSQIPSSGAPQPSGSASRVNSLAERDVSADPSLNSIYNYGPKPSGLPVFPASLEVDWGVMLGSGGYGQVFKGRWTPQPWAVGTTQDPAAEPRDVAVKVMTPSRNEKEKLDKIRSFQEEAGMMGRFAGCDRVVDMIAADVESDTCWIVYELLPNGTLASRIHDESRPQFSLMAALRYALDVAKGVKALHDIGVVHRDLKPDNLLLDANKRPKLIDFGISRERDPNKTSITTECVGTWAYMAPEQFSNRVSEKVDVYALGVCVWEIWTRQHPWQDVLNEQPWQLVIAIMNDEERLPIPSNCPAPLRSLMEDCWLADPKARPTMTEIVERLEDIIRTTAKRRHTRSASCGGIPVLEHPQLAAVEERVSSGPTTPKAAEWFTHISSQRFDLAAAFGQDLSEWEGRQTQSAKDLSFDFFPESSPPVVVGASRFGPSQPVEHDNILLSLDEQPRTARLLVPDFSQGSPVCSNPLYPDS